MSRSLALVTGASSGIGVAFARRLAAAGTGLVLVARNEARLSSFAQELRNAHGVDVEILSADLSDPADLGKVEQRVGDATVPVDLVVNNAGYTTYGEFAELRVGDEAGQVDLHVRATLRLTHAAARRMRKQGPGGIVNVSSAAAFQPGPGLVTYTGTKAFIVSFSESLHEELRGDGVTVTCVCPGYTRTELQRRADVDMSHLPNVMWQSADEVARAGLDGHARGRAVVVPGLVNRVMAASSRLMPRALARKAAAKLLRQR